MAVADISRNGRFGREYRKLLGRLHPADSRDAERFAQELLGQGLTAGRVLKYLLTLGVVSRRIGKPLRELTAEDVNTWAVWLHTESGYTEWYRCALITMVRKYLRWLGREELAKLLKLKLPKNSRLPEEILTEEEIRRLAEATCNTRDRAFVLALYESGCRVGEFLPLKLKHVSFDSHGAVLRVEGKTGARRVRVIASAIALQRWLEEHPEKNNPEAYLWCPLPTPNNPRRADRCISYNSVHRLLKELAKRAGVRKNVHPHALRHARATHLARHLTEAQMKEFFGWTQDSSMAATYVHLSGRDVDSTLLGIYGIQEAREAQQPVLKPQECPRCQEVNDPASKFCRRCGLPLKDAQVADKLEDVIFDLLKAVAELNPEVKKRFEQIVKEKGVEELFE